MVYRYLIRVYANNKIVAKFARLLQKAQMTNVEKVERAAYINNHISFRWSTALGKLHYRLSGRQKPRDARPRWDCLSILNNPTAEHNMLQQKICNYGSSNDFLQYDGTQIGMETNKKEDRQLVQYLNCNRRCAA